MKFEVRWFQPEQDGCGEEGCSKVFDDREEAFDFSYRLDTQVCKGIRVYTLALALTPEGRSQEPVAPKAPHKPHATKTTKRFVVMGLSAEATTSGRQGYKVMLVGEPGESRVSVSAKRDYTILGQFVVTESHAKRHYSAAWKAYQTKQEAAHDRYAKLLYGDTLQTAEATPEAPQTQPEPVRPPARKMTLKYISELGKRL